MKTPMLRLSMLTLLGGLFMTADSLESFMRRTKGADLADTTKPYNSCSIDNTAFQAGEEMVYKVYYNWNFVWMSAGEVVFRVNDVGGQYHISVLGSTYKSYEWFYRVLDKYDTYVDKQTLLPEVSIRDVQEGKYRLYDKIVFDRQRNVARSLRGKSKETAEITEYPVESCMHDILSIIYYARNINYDQLTPGAEIPIKVFVDKKTWSMRVKYKGRDDRKKIRNQGRYKTIVFSPEVATGFYFDTKDKMNVWVSDDKNRIPLMIESPLSVGSIKAVLKDYKGLRHPFTAEIKEPTVTPAEETVKN